MKKILLIIGCLLAIAAIANGGFQDYSWDEMRFGGSDDGERSIVFDQFPTVNSAKIKVDPADNEFVFNNPSRFENDINVLGHVKVTSTTKSSRPCPPMTQAERDNLSNVENGDCVFNTDTNTLNIYNTEDFSWSEAGGGGTGGSFAWEITNGIAPFKSIENDLELFGFYHANNIQINSTLTVPDNYRVGKQITLQNVRFVPKGDGQFQFRTVSTLIKRGGKFTSTFTHTSNRTFSEAVESDDLLIAFFELSDNSGQIGGEDVEPGDLILIKLSRVFITGANINQDPVLMIKNSSSISME